MSGAREPRAPSTGGSGRRTGEREECHDDTRAGPRVRYRCCGCGFEFVPALPRAAPCPRCGSIGGHEAIGKAGGGQGGS
jgi:hypothetical protein